jgi:hypothetical protein
MTRPNTFEEYGLRFTIEVLVQDWKTYEGWGALTQPSGEEGSSRSLGLCLRVAHGLLLHPVLRAPLHRRQPAYSVGSLIHKLENRGRAIFEMPQH